MIRTKHLFVLINIRNKGEVCAIKLVKALQFNIFTDRSKAVLLLWIICVTCILCLSCSLVCSLQPCGHLLGKDWPLSSLVRMFSCGFVTFQCSLLGQVWCFIVLFLIFVFFLTQKPHNQNLRLTFDSTETI